MITPLPKSVSQKLRMAGRDYSRRGLVFVTLSADYHRHVFGEIGAISASSNPHPASPAGSGEVGGHQTTEPDHPDHEKLFKSTVCRDFQHTAEDGRNYLTLTSSLFLQERETL